MMLQHSNMMFILCIGLTLMIKVSAQDGQAETETTERTIHISILSISICFALPAIFIYWRHSNVKLPKFRAVIFLIAALIIRDIFTLASAVLLFQGGTNDLACLVLTTIGIFLGTTVYCCLLLEAIFVHRLLTSVFITHTNREPAMRYYYTLAAVIALGSTLAWYLVKVEPTTTECQLLGGNENMDWVYNGTRAALLLINTVLMVHIIITLWKTFRYRPSVQHVAIRTGLANIGTVPIFLVHLLWVTLFMNPDNATNNSNQNFRYICYALEGLQTISVTLVHFYIDQPVVNALASYRSQTFICCTGQQSNFILNRQPSMASTNRHTWITIIEDDYFMCMEPSKNLPSPTVKFYEDPLDRGPNYYVSMTSLDEEIKKIEGKDDIKGDDSSTPNVIRNDSGFWYYKNRNVYLREIEGVIN